MEQRSTSRWVVVGIVLSLTLLALSVSAAEKPQRKSETGVEVVRPVGPGLPSQGAESTLDAIIGANVRANSRETCADGRGITQSETAIAAFGDNIVVAFNDTRGGCDTSRGLIGYAYSRDGGLTFVDGGGLPHDFDSGDPWLAVNSNGTFFLSGIWQRTNALAIVRGTFTETGLTWDTPTVLGGRLYDKPALTMDPNDGTLYLAYTRLFVGIQVRRSTDDGRTWATSTTIPNTAANQGAFPVVGPAGEVYVAIVQPNLPSGMIKVAKSENGGRSFYAPVPVGDVCGFVIPGLNRPETQQRLLAMPTLGVDTTGGVYNGNLYAAWHSGCGSNGDVLLSRSEDGGSTWSDPVRVTDDVSGGMRFYPSLSVDANGYVNVIFYDRRENPGTAVTNVYFAQSRDGGRTFTNTKVTSVASDWTQARFDAQPNYGDYIYSISVGSDVLATWADSRDGDPDTYFARISPTTDDFNQRP